jgi:hypothetical protein
MLWLGGLMLGLIRGLLEAAPVGKTPKLVSHVFPV